MCAFVIESERSHMWLSLEIYIWFRCELSGKCNRIWMILKISFVFKSDFKDSCDWHFKRYNLLNLWKSYSGAKEGLTC